MARAAAGALILLAAWGAPAAGEEPPRPAGPSPTAAAPAPPPRETGRGPAPPRGREGQGERRLDEVRITGSAESPDVLFFLPRARFRLLPLPPGTDWKGRLLADSPDLEKAPR